MTLHWLLLPWVLTAAPSRSLESVFLHRAPVTVNAPGPTVLPLTAEVLAECRADRGDLRLVDEKGTQVPYWLDTGDIRPPPPAQTEQPTLKTVSRRQYKAEGAPTTFEETLTLTAPIDRQSTWSFMLGSPVHVYVAELEWSWVNKDKRQEAHTVSVFRLADGRAQTRVQLGTPKGEALHLTLRGENGGYLEPSILYERETPTDERALMPLPQAKLEFSKEERTTKVSMPRSEGWRETELRFETTTPVFSRRIRIYDVQEGQPKALIGAGVISRLPRSADGPAVSGSAYVEQLTVRLAPARGNHLEVEIDDGDSPGLSDLKISSYTQAPRLLFYATSEHVGPQKLTLLVGSRHIAPPVYDVAQLDTQQVGAQFAHAAYAQLQALTPNPAHDAYPLLEYAWSPGAEMKTSAYSHQAPLYIADSGEGVTRLILPVDVVAHARADLGDVRVIDTQSRQMPYVRLASALAPEWVPLKMATPVRAGGDTRIVLTGTQGPVAWQRLRLQAPNPFVERSFTVRGLSPANNEWVLLSSGTLSRSNQSTAQLDITLPAMAVSELELNLKEGDAAPLLISGAEAEVSLPVLHVLAPPGNYTLLVGQPEATAPNYQLESLRELINQLDAPKVQLLGPLSSNPDFTRLARLRQGSGPERAAVWGALGLGVLVLGVFTLRLLRNQPTGT
ncbi:MAG: DUF3999 domain-containing protein [Myxococcaceae bacterium]|nr:DUF3999 domain-containing protein [Myxococcaceae bacterium]